LALPVVLLVCWQAGVATHRIDPFFVSSPLAIVGKIWEWVLDGSIVVNVGITLAETLLGFAVGVIIGVALGFMLFENRTLAEICEPYLAIFNAIPRVILAPLFVLWFGLGLGSKVVLVATVTLLIVFFNTYAGLNEVDNTLISSMRVMGATTSKIRSFVLFPSVVVWIFGSLRATIGLAFAAAVVGEYVGSTHGIGYLIADSQGTFSSAGVFAGLAIVTIVVFILSWVLDAVEAYMQRWKR
jgi:NitT/TauT family transport system permease protein